MPSGAQVASVRRRSAVAGLLLACHPAPAFAVAAFATALAVASGRAPGGIALVGAAVVTGQLSVGWSNDRIDLERDRAAGRRDKPLAAGELSPEAVGTAAACALALCVPLSLASGPAAGAAHLAGVGAAWAYNLRLKRTALSWLPYAVAFGLLPAFVTLGLPGAPWPKTWVLIAGALLGTGAHFANVLPDIEDDLRAGVRGLPQRLGRRVSGAVAVLLLTAASVTLAAPLGGPGRLALVVTAPLALTTAVAPHGRWPFLAALANAAVDVALLLSQSAALS
jgi:4-hydroxybenzoate polyprenyltransferase